jgi:hypothetical protein
VFDKTLKSNDSSKLVLRVLNILVSIFLLLSAFTLLIFRLSDFLPSTIPIKDPAFFLQKYNYFLENGWYQSIVIGTSPFFNGMVWLLDFLINNPYKSMKVLSIASMIGTIIIWFYFGKSVLKISSRYSFLFFSFLTYLAFYRNAFFSGTNDGLFCLLISLGVVFLFKSILRESVVSLWLSGLFFALSFSTREIFVFYLPGIIVIILLLRFKKQFKVAQIFGFLGIFIVMSFALYYPSLIEEHTFKFADKNEGVGNWPEKNYLQVYLGEAQISFQDVENFKISNPSITLPKSYSEAVFLDLKLTASNFFRQLVLIQKSFIWQTGILFLLFIGIALKKLLELEFLNLNTLALVLFITFIFSFSILLINRVEFRWFMVFPFLFSTLAFASLSDYHKKFPLIEVIFLVNCIIISIMNFGLIGVWK